MPIFTVIVTLTLLNNANAFDFCTDNIGVEHMPRAEVVYSENNISIPDPTYVPLTIDMAKNFGIDLPAGGELEAQFGMIEIYKDGHILYDGKDISSDIEGSCNNDPNEFETIIDEQSENGDYTDTGR